jgi:GTP-binding protein
MLLFMIPADSQDINAEYEVLLNELRQYNPELLDKKRLLAISKADLLDEELKNEIKKDLPPIDFMFISSITNMGLDSLKDKLWEALNN